MMIWLFILSGVALMVACFLAGRMSVRTETMVFAPLPPIATPSTQLELALASLAQTRAWIGVVQSARVVPVSSFTVLESVPVPDPVEGFTVQGLMDENQNLRTELVKVTERFTALYEQADRRRNLHWNSLKRLRAKVQRMVDVQELANTEALRIRSLTVAKTAQSRAADLSQTLTEVEVALAEAQTLDEMQTEFEQILVRHQNGIAV